MREGERRRVEVARPRVERARGWNCIWAGSNSEGAVGAKGRKRERWTARNSIVGGNDVVALQIADKDCRLPASCGYPAVGLVETFLRDANIKLNCPPQRHTTTPTTPTMAKRKEPEDVESVEDVEDVEMKAADSGSDSDSEVSPHQNPSSPRPKS